MLLARVVLRWRLHNPPPSLKSSANSSPGRLDLRPNPSLSVSHAADDRLLDASTQHFNTTHSMGRLTLNILLWFAQFEREIIG